MNKKLNKIEKLIEELCPDGIEFKELGEVTNIKTGQGLGDNVVSEIGNYAYVNAGIEPSGFIDNRNSEAKTITIPSRGQGGAGHVGYQKNDFWCGSLCYKIQSKVDKIITKFVYYYLKNIQNKIIELRQTGSIPAVNKKELEKVKIPIPPLPIQEEIVKILDNFTELEAELKAELEARKKQYEHYREELLNFGDGVEFKKLGEVCEMKAGKSISASDISSLISDDNIYPCIGGNGSRGYVNSFSHSGKFSIIGRQGALCGNVCFVEGKFYATEHAVVVKHGEQFISRFLYHLLFLMNLNQYATGGAQPGLAVSRLNKIKIPIPPIEEQERIAAILDKFDTLVNDISIGLPAELSARRKQYEYYRENLFNQLRIKSITN